MSFEDGHASAPISMCLGWYGCGAGPRARAAAGIAGNRISQQQIAERSEAVMAAFRQGLAEAGHIVGQNVMIEYRWAEGDYQRLPELAAELIRLRVAVILAAGGPPSALAAKKATTTIPVVFSAAGDPVRIGLVDSLSRPGANVTGMGLFNSTLGGKRLELLHQLVPASKIVALLTNPDNPSAELELREVRAAAKLLNIDLQEVTASTDQELSSAFNELSRLRTGALIVSGERSSIAAAPSSSACG